MPRKKREKVELGSTYLRPWREYKDMTLEGVGKLLGWDKSSLSRIETGALPYNQVHLQQLSKVYGVSIVDLLFTDPLAPRPSD
jgi:transcriptional regulator with XRE-family HTH domain